MGLKLFEVLYFYETMRSATTSATSKRAMLFEYKL